MISVTFREDRIMTGKKDSQQINTVACSSLKSKLFVGIIVHVPNCDPQHIEREKQGRYNSVDQDKMASNSSSEQGLHCFTMFQSIRNIKTSKTIHPYCTGKTVRIRLYLRHG